MPTAIEWSDETCNPVTGCTRVSPGCLGAHCYIERTPPFRMEGRRFTHGADGATTGVRLHPERLEQPLHWRKPRRVFVNSLSDLFHDDVPDHFIAGVCAIMSEASHHTFQVLTKRPERARDFLAAQPKWRLPENVWLGVSIENARFTWRADVLREIPAAVRFISAEPLLGSLFPETTPGGAHGEGLRWPLDLTGIDWVIVGGESGPGARPMHPEWARELRDACIDPSLGHWYADGEHAPAFFFKQVGEWLPYWPYAQQPFWATHDGSLYDAHHLPVGLSEGDPVRNRSGDTWWAPDPGDEVIYRRVGKKRAGRHLDGRTWDEFPAAIAATQKEEPCRSSR